MIFNIKSLFFTEFIILFMKNCEINQRKVEFDDDVFRKDYA